MQSRRRLVRFAPATAQVLASLLMLFGALAALDAARAQSARAQGAPAAILTDGNAVVTGFSGVTATGSAPSSADPADLILIDLNLPAAWGPQGGPGSIWKIDGGTGAASLFANVMLGSTTNSGPALGGLAFDPNSRSSRRPSAKTFRAAAGASRKGRTTATAAAPSQVAGVAQREKQIPRRRPSATLTASANGVAK